ncbi:hypothetical protein [Salinisphaera hydrothermalis]|uniref:hypothetical protein n=1 Tax=Salinisphaera hydrothermalis TaxID=563188 RepID=UPI00333E685A
MKSVRLSTRHQWLGLVLALLGVLGAIYFGAGARHATLDSAARQAVHDLPPALGASDRGDPQAVVHRLVTTGASEMAFLTVRNAQGRLVASDGAWSSWFAGMAPQATVRTWRAWMYRTLCAEIYRTTSDGAELHAGVPWWRVFVHAAPAFWLTLILAFLGLALFERARRRPRDLAVTASPRVAHATDSAPSESRKKRPTPARQGTVHRVRQLLRRDRPADTANSPGPSGGFEPIGRRRQPPEYATHPPAETTTPAPQGGIVEVRERVAVSPPLSEAAGAGEATPHRPAEIAPKPIDQPSTLDQFRLRFEPIWRGTLEGLLAGAAVRVLRVTESGERTRTLEALMADGVPPERVVRWLVQRVVTLQANWRSVELPRVPVMVPLPDALLAFENAGETWATALAQAEPAVGELILCVERQPDWATEAALPVRWAVAERREHAAAAVIYRMVSGPDAERAELDAEEGDRFVLPDDPANVADVQRPLEPKTFAQLMSRSELVPL